MGKMKGIQIVKPEELRIIETDIPELNDTDNVLVKIKAAGICGSDVGIYMERTPPPLTPGSSAMRWSAKWFRPHRPQRRSRPETG